MEEEYDTCEIPKEDIRYYSMMIYALNRGADGQAGEMREYLSNYGKDVKKIQSKIGKHLDGCFSCNSHYKECLEDEVKAERFVRTKFFTEGGNIGIANRRIKKTKEWGIEHAAYESPESLRDYLWKKTIYFSRREALKLSSRFDKHIEDCNSCQELYNLQLEVLRDMLKARGGNFGEKEK